MRLTQFTDFSMRALLYLGVHRGRLVSSGEIAASYRVSFNHMAKVTASLVELGLVESVRGRGGGLRLAVEPSTVNVGWLVRRTEPDFVLVECFDRERDTCPITPACRLKHVLMEAQRAFLEVLDGHTLADFVGSPERAQAFVRLWSAARGEEEDAALPVLGA